MENKFHITYGRRDQNGNTYQPCRAIAHNADEAIAIINTWMAYGIKTPSERLVVDKTTGQKIRDLFRDGFGAYPGGEPRTYMGFCLEDRGDWEIVFRPAFADTIKEHERIYNERCKSAGQGWLHESDDIKQRKLAMLYKQQRGWYRVELDLEIYVSSERENDYIADTTFTGDILANCGMDAYDMALEFIRSCPQEIVNYHGCTSTLYRCSKATSNGYMFQFLGIKTDDGYNMTLYDEWKKKGWISD